MSRASKAVSGVPKKSYKISAVFSSISKFLSIDYLTSCSVISGYSNISKDGNYFTSNNYLLLSRNDDENFVFGMAMDDFEDCSFGDVFASFRDDNPDIFELVFEI